MSNIKISQLPYIGNTGYTVTDIVPFVSYINPTGTTSETKIDDLKDYILENSFVKNIITVGKGGNVQFNTLYDAVTSITGSSDTNRYTIQVGPGVYVEPPIDLTGKPYVSIVGSDINTVSIIPDNITNTIFNLGDNNELSFLTISGATSGVGVLCQNIGGFALLHKVSMLDNDIQINLFTSFVDTQFYCEYVDFGGDYSYGVYVLTSPPYNKCRVNLENHFNDISGSKPTIAHFVKGSGSSITSQGGINFGNNIVGSECYHSEDYGNMVISGVEIYDWEYAIRVVNNGGGSTFDVDGVSILGSITYDLLVEHPNTYGTIQGSLSHSLINNVSENVFWSFLDHIDGELDITRKLSVTFKDGTHTDLSTLLFEGGTMGVLSGGTISIVTGLTFSISEGYGYLESVVDDGIIKRYDWINIQHTLLPNSNQYIYINNNGVLSNSGSRPDSTNNIILGRVVTNSTDIIMIDDSPLYASHTSNLYDDLFINGIGTIYNTGSIVTENVTPYHLDVTGGDYYYSTSQYLPSGGTDVAFTMYYRDGGTGWSTSATTEVIIGYDDNSGTISPLPLTAFTKHTLYVIGEGVNEQYFLVLGQNYYTTLLDAENALLPIPPTYFDGSVTQISNIYIQEGTTGITQVEDIRPIIGFRAGGVNASSIHGNLLGLTADDHTQYLLVNGGRSMTNDLNMGTNNINSAGTINGVTIETHASRHQNGGADQIGTATPTPSAIPYADTNGKLNDWIGGDITGSTNFTNSLSAYTMSATTYYNLPANPGTYVTGYTYNDNIFTIKQNDGQPDLTASIDTVTGWTVNGILTVTGDTSMNSVSATTMSATTYQNLPVDPDTYVTGYTYSDNIFTIKQNNGQPDLTSTIDAVTGWTVNGLLTVTGNTSMSSVTASTITIQNVTGTPSIPISLDSSGKIVSGSTSANLGRTLFVSISGNNSTAIVGDINKPWADVFTAMSASTSGDTIHVFPQTIILDNTTGPISTVYSNKYNLWKDGVTYYWEAGCKVIILNDINHSGLALFRPNGVVNESCKTIGYLEYEQYSTAGAPAGGTVYYFQGTTIGLDVGYTFYSQTKSQTSYCSGLVSIDRTSASVNTTANITIISDYQKHNFTANMSGGGQTENMTGGDCDTILYYNVKKREGSNLGSFRLNGNMSRVTVNIVGDVLIQNNFPTTRNQIMWTIITLGTNAVINVNIGKIYYSTTNATANGSILYDNAAAGGVTYNFTGDLIPATTSTNTSVLFELGSIGNVLNYNGNITTNTTSGIGNSIAYVRNTSAVINIKGDINYIGTGVTTNYVFKTNFGGTVNYNGKVSGNFANPIATCLTGIININNSFIQSFISGNASSVMLNGGSTLGTVRINNSYIEMKNNVNAISNGSYVKGLISNSVIVNSGSANTLENTTAFGSLQLLNSTVISSGTSINYTSTSPVTSSSSVTNTVYSINTLNGIISTITDITY